MVDNRLQLIAEIYSRPGLWDFHHEDYKDRTCYQKLWNEVAASMGRNVTVDDCKRKWKNLRDAYRAEIKRIEIRIEKDILRGRYDPKNDYCSKWSYFEHLTFIKDIKRPIRNSFKGNLNVSSDNICADDDNDLEKFAELNTIDSPKPEPDAGSNEQPYLLDESDDSNNSQIYSENLLKEAENQQQDHTKNTLQKTPAIKVNLLTQCSAKTQMTVDDKSEPSCSKCSKRSYEQMHFLEDLEKEEQNLIKSTRLDITRSSNLDHVGDSDYNFLVSFLPQLKKMSELQNLQFRAKITDFMLTLMSSSLQNRI